MRETMNFDRNFMNTVERLTNGKGARESQFSSDNRSAHWMEPRVDLIERLGASDGDLEELAYWVNLLLGAGIDDPEEFRNVLTEAGRLLADGSSRPKTARRINSRTVKDRRGGRRSLRNAGR